MIYFEFFHFCYDYYFVLLFMLYSYFPSLLSRHISNLLPEA